MSELNKPAMPGLHPSKECRYSEEGMTIRQHAAITLRVPMSGDQELDAMIREARRLDMATAAMQGFLPAWIKQNANWTDMATRLDDFADTVADALLAASDNSEPQTGNWIAVDDYYRNCRRLDVALNGEENAAQRPCLIDILSQVEQVAHALGRPVLAASEPKKSEPDPMWCEAHGAQRCEECQPQPDAEGWIEWKGGKCPVQKGTAIVVRYRDGEQSGIIPALELLNHIPRDASRYFWECDYFGNDIIAYRIVKE